MVFPPSSNPFPEIAPPSTAADLKEEKPSLIPSFPDRSILSQILQLHSIQQLEKGEKDTEKGEKIEEELSKFEEILQAGELADLLIETEELEQWIVEKIEVASSSLEEGAEFLEKLLPKDIFEQFPSSEVLKEISELTSLGCAFLTAVNAGFNGAALIWKAKIIQQAENFINRRKEEKVEGSLSKELLKWEQTIQIERENLDHELVQYHLSTASTVLSLSHLPINFFAKGNFLQYTKAAGNAIPLVTGVLDLIAEILAMKKTAQETTLFNKWREGLQERSAKLLDEREKILQKKASDLLPKFEEIKGKIEGLKEKAFEREMQNLLHLIEDPHHSQEGLRKTFEAWGFYRPSASPQVKQFWNFLYQIAPDSKQPLQRDLHNELLTTFKNWVNNPQAKQEQFQAWFKGESKENKMALLSFYADHQETIEITTKNALKQMVEKKYEIENKFIQFQLADSSIQLSVSSITLVATISLTILGLLTIPFGGVGALLLGLSIGSSIITLGLFGAGYILSRIEKPNTTKFLSLLFQAKMMWANLRKAISLYSHQRIAEKFHALDQLVKNGSEETSDKYLKAQRNYEESKKKVAYWTERLDQLEKAVTEKAWQDFVLQADLKINNESDGFDTLRAFQEAFAQCDLELLSEETKTFLEKNLGLDLQALQDEIDHLPEIVHATLQEFFTQSSSGLISFIKKQELQT